MATVPVVGLFVALSPAAGAGTVAASPNARAVAEARAAIEHLKIGSPGTNHWASGHSIKVHGQTQVQSNNWSGYADTGSGFTQAAGHWIEPKASCGSAQSLAAFWVGIDGFTSSSVEQDGTLIECNGGTPSYFTWWEMYPTNAIQVVGDTLAPGDSVNASVVRKGNSYTLRVNDVTRPADSFVTTQSCSCSNNSAEWIAEAPSGSSGIFPLSNFGNWILNGAVSATTAKSGVISSFPDDEITMVDTSGTVEAQPSSLSTNGRRFNVTWKSST